MTPFHIYPQCPWHHRLRYNKWLPDTLTCLDSKPTLPLSLLWWMPREPSRIRLNRISQKIYETHIVPVDYVFDLLDSELCCFSTEFCCCGGDYGGQENENDLAFSKTRMFYCGVGCCGYVGGVLCLVSLISCGRSFDILYNHSTQRDVEWEC